jgi:transcriptional regulator GlxA family with amidase domain
MTKYPQKRTKIGFLPKTISMMAYDGAQVLDITGPLEVFSMANRLIQERKKGKSGRYKTEILAEKKGPVVSSSGITLLADRSIFSDLKKIDTLIVPGGEGVFKSIGNRKLLCKLKEICKNVGRFASVCTGSFILAEAGLLNGKIATTHWAESDHFASRYPNIIVQPDKIFTQDGHIYTSAGVTAGIDLALALVEEDHGRQTALQVAKTLVVFMKRQGGQAQFSKLLSSQIKLSGGLKGLPEWIMDNPGQNLSVQKLARKCGMSERNFSRSFAKETNMTPGKFVEKVRIDYAILYLESEDMPLEQVAIISGFGTAEKMRRAFLRNLKVLPGTYKKRFGI